MCIRPLEVSFEKALIDPRKLEMKERQKAQHLAAGDREWQYHGGGSSSVVETSAPRGIAGRGVVVAPKACIQQQHCADMLAEIAIIEEEVGKKMI